MQTIKVLVLGLDRSFELTDKQTGEVIAGQKLYFAQPRNENNGGRGLEVFEKCFMRGDRQVLQGITSVPGYYEVQIDFDLRGNKAIPRYQSFKMLEPLKLGF